MALDGILFDLDGTLVDTNEMHVRAWQRALERRGYRIAADRIWVEVGKGGDKLVPDLLGREADEKDGDALRDAQPCDFEKIAKAEGIKPFPRAVELLKAIRGRGLKLALATSSSKGHLKTIAECSLVAWQELLDEVVTADDAEQSKPAADPLVAAYQKLKLSPAQCAMIGDTQYDASSSRAAGVVCLGLLSGRNSEHVLRSAGARTVFRDTADLLDHVDEALKLASPGPAHLTQASMEKLMREALDVARSAMERGEAPIGCVLARGDLSIVASGHNEMNATQNKTAHAEIVTFAAAAGKVPLDARDLIIVSTLEPCVMCTGAAMEAAIDTIIYAHPAPTDAGTERVACPKSPESQMPRIVGEILKDESRKLFEAFLKKEIRPEQRKYVEQLLARA